MPSKITGNENRTFRKRTEEEIKIALAKHSGLLTPAALELGYTDRTSLETRIRNNPALKAYQVQCIEANIDVAESQLKKAIDNGEAWAIQFYLKTQAKHRGYGDSLHVTSLAINANVNYNFDLDRLETEEVGRLYDYINRCTIEAEPIEPTD